MNRIAAFMLLDFRSLPTLQRVFVPCFLFLWMLMFFFDNPEKGASAVLPGFILVFLVIIQPCIITEKNRLETLYATLPLTRDDVVKAKYLYAVCIQAVVMLPALLLKPLFFTNNGTAYFITGTFLTVSFLTAMLYPLYFKIGINKTNAVMAVLFIIIFIVLFASRSLPGFAALCARIIPATSPGKAAAGLLFLCLSYLLSLRIYRTRDL